MYCVSSIRRATCVLRTSVLFLVIRATSLINGIIRLRSLDLSLSDFANLPTEMPSNPEGIAARICSSVGRGFSMRLIGLDDGRGVIELELGVGEKKL